MFTSNPIGYVSSPIQPGGGGGGPFYTDYGGKHNVFQLFFLACPAHTPVFDCPTPCSAPHRSLGNGRHASARLAVLHPTPAPAVTRSCRWVSSYFSSFLYKSAHNSLAYRPIPPSCRLHRHVQWEPGRAYSSNFCGPLR